MNETMLAIKATLAAFFTALGTFLGWKGIMAVVWVALMAMDYISGTVAAIKDKSWCSEVARQGLWHKGGMILVVAVAGIADGVIVVIGDHLPLGFNWPGLVLPLVLAWYIITEMGSICENAVKLGANVPEWFVRILKIGLKAVNDAGESAAGETEADISAIDKEE